MSTSSVQRLEIEANFHFLFGLAAILPYGFQTFPLLIGMFYESGDLSFAPLFTPLVLMAFVPLAIYISMARHMRVTFAKSSLLVLAGGFACLSFYVFSMYLGKDAAIFCSGAFSYLCVRIVGSRIYKKDLTLTENEVLQANG